MIIYNKKGTLTAGEQARYYSLNILKNLVKCSVICSSLVLMSLVNPQEVSAQEVAKPSVDSIQKIGELKAQKESNGPSDQTDKKENRLSDQTAQKRKLRKFRTFE